jgi:hypothetical protein
VTRRRVAATAGLALAAILLLAGAVSASSNSKGTTKSETTPLPAGETAVEGKKCPSNSHPTGAALR